MQDQPYRFPDLGPLFDPESIAVVGASDKAHSIGNHTFRNIVEHSRFGGRLYPVNPKQSEVMGLTCYPDVASLPEPVDVVVIVVPAQYVRKTVEQAGQTGCRFAVILTSGFSEADDWGIEFEDLGAFPEYAAFVPTPQHEEWLQHLEGE